MLVYLLIRLGLLLITNYYKSQDYLQNLLICDKDIVSTNQLSVKLHISTSSINYIISPVDDDAVDTAFLQLTETLDTSNTLEGIISFSRVLAKQKIRAIKLEISRYTKGTNTSNKTYCLSLRSIVKLIILLTILISSIRSI